MTARSAVAAAGAVVDIDAIAAAVAAEVGAQAACAAAITAASLATASAVSTLQTDVDALPNGASIEARCQSAIVTECGQFGAIRTLTSPTISRVITGELTGSTSYVLQGFVTDKRFVLHGFTITSDAATTLTWWSGIAAPVTDGHAVPANGMWEVSASSMQTFRLNLEDALILRSSNSAAKLHVTYQYAAVDFYA